MRERAETAGGWWRLETTPGDGTCVEFWIPAVAGD
jgi:signal transduction histidine kinase